MGKDIRFQMILIIISQQVPNDPDYYLSTTYSNHMKIPSVINHHHTNVADVRNVEDINLAYEKAIKRLNSVNLDFK